MSQKNSAGIRRVPKAVYEAELRRLQAELVSMQQWVKESGSRVVAIFEGRDAAGKGSAIKRVTEYLNPRLARIVALPTPTDENQKDHVEHGVTPESARQPGAESGGGQADQMASALVKNMRRVTMGCG